MEQIHKHKKKIVLILVTLSLAWATLSAFLFFTDYGRLHRSGFMPGPRGWHKSHQHDAPSARDVERVQPWMTFSFVNKIFGLPPEYLKDKLNLANTAYPNVTIDAAAKTAAVSPQVLLLSLKNILSQRIASAASTTTP